MTYLSEVLADAPIHYWRLADPPGAVANDIGSLLPQPLIGGANQYGMLGYSGPSSDAGCFVAQAGTSMWLGSVRSLQVVFPVTVEWVLWVPGPRADAIQCFPWGWADAGFGPYQNELGTGQYSFNFNGATSVPLSFPAPNAWHHFAFQYNTGQTTFSYFQDGTLQAQPAIAAAAAWNGQLLLGRRNAAGAQFIGAISEFAVYNATLSTGRMDAHRAAIDRPVSPPVFRQAGVWDAVTGTTSGGAADLAAVLAAVRKVYSSLP